MHELALLPLVLATWQTIYMVFIACFLSTLAGLALGSFLFLTRSDQALAQPFIYRALSFIINVTRSIPFIILMISIIPLTRLVIGTSIGTNAAIMPLTIAAVAFYARICESALLEVPQGLIEAAQAMGASTWQTMTKVLIPESMPSLIRGATLTIIALISYSAMAGVVGGGGLGELAVNYGYQRFNLVVMTETVVILIVMVQLIQMLGDKLAQRPNFKIIMGLCLLLGTGCCIQQLWPTNDGQRESIRVGVMSGWPQEVMQVAREVANKDYGMDIQIITFSDYVQPNTALNNNSIDANIFQHGPYLDAQVAAHQYNIVSIAKTFVYPMGFYSEKIANVNELKRGAIIAIPNDPSNGGRALLLLAKSGLITLKQNSGVLATVSDITSNPLHLHFKELDAAQLPRVLKDADLVAITNDFVSAAHLSIKQAILKEGADSPYANIIVIKASDKDKPMLQKLIEVMHSPAVIQKTQQIFPDGAAIPAWHKDQK